MDGFVSMIYRLRERFPEGLLLDFVPGCGIVALLDTFIG